MAHAETSYMLYEHERDTKLAGGVGAFAVGGSVAQGPVDPVLRTRLVTVWRMPLGEPLGQAAGMAGYSEKRTREIARRYDSGAGASEREAFEKGPRGGAGGAQGGLF